MSTARGGITGNLEGCFRIDFPGVCQVAWPKPTSRRWVLVYRLEPAREIAPLRRILGKHKAANRSPN